MNPVSPFAAELVAIAQKNIGRLLSPEDLLALHKYAQRCDRTLGDLQLLAPNEAEAWADLYRQALNSNNASDILEKQNGTLPDEVPAIFSNVTVDFGSSEPIICATVLEAAMRSDPEHAPLFADHWTEYRRAFAEARFKHLKTDSFALDRFVRTATFLVGFDDTDDLMSYINPSPVVGKGVPPPKTKADPGNPQPDADTKGTDQNGTPSNPNDKSGLASVNPNAIPSHPSTDTLSSVGQVLASLRKMIGTVLKHTGQAGQPGDSTALNPTGDVAQNPPPQQNQPPGAPGPDGQPATSTPNAAQGVAAPTSPNTPQALPNSKTAVVPGPDGQPMHVPLNDKGHMLGQDGQPMLGPDGQPMKPPEPVDEGKVNAFTNQIKSKLSGGKFGDGFVGAAHGAIKKQLNNTEAIKLFGNLVKPGAAGVPKNRGEAARRIRDAMISHPNYQKPVVDPSQDGNDIESRLSSYLEGDAILRAILATPDDRKYQQSDLSEALSQMGAAWAALTDGKLGGDYSSQNWREQLTRTMQQAFAKAGNAQQALRVMAQQARSRLSQAIAADSPALFNYSSDHMLDPAALRGIGDAMQFMSLVLQLNDDDKQPQRLLGSEFWGDIRFESCPENYARSGMQDKGDSNFVVFMPPRGGARSVMHAMGHILESCFPKCRDAAEAFRVYRSSGAKPQPINRFPGGQALDPTELGVDIKSQFLKNAASYYAGKLNPKTKRGGGGTEIVSMGLESLYEDPVGFCMQDPEYAKFIIGILRGVFR